MRSRLVLLVPFSLALIAVVAYCGGPAWRLIEDGPAGIHQRSVKNELAALEREYRLVRNWREAWRAAEVLEGTPTYYVPKPGYRGSTRTEAELETQRAQTLESIAAGLREFTGQDFGTEAALWQKWLIEQGHAEGR